MIGLFEPIAAACAIEVPAGHRLPVAIVGAGAIVDLAHLPAYTAGGIEVVGIHDIDPKRAAEVAERHGIARIYSTVDDLLADDSVAVVDVAVPAAAQPEIARRVLAAGRHMLGQKPFAPSAAVGAELAGLADAHGVVLAVNQQLRFDEGMAAAHAMVEAGWLGELTAMSITVNIWTEWRDWPWMLATPRLEISNHSIHYHDVVRWFLGEPETVFCAGGRTPGQAPTGETRTISTATYPSGALSIVHANHENDRADNAAEFRIDGSQGSIRGTLGLLYDYPHGRPDTVDVSSAVVPTDGWVPYPVTTRWIPDAFLGPMASLLNAVATGQPPRSSGRENVGTLRVVDALYASIRTGAAQRLAG
ncbi:MAG TPA: Gfo/Idh/MocA family oxidoreductase [Mycobacteriales bacterium]|nr:Gfo/Idh/MocA family oxidoreductase [Mycobacteriales bacterium]